MKRRVLVQVEEGTHAAWKARAFSEGRSMSELARDLIERAVLTGRGASVASGGSVRRALGDGGADRPRSVSADAAATVPVVGGAHMKRDRPAVECPGRVFVDGVCQECGKAVT